MANPLSLSQKQKDSKEAGPPHPMTQILWIQKNKQNDPPEHPNPNSQMSTKETCEPKVDLNRRPSGEKTIRSSPLLSTEERINPDPVQAPPLTSQVPTQIESDQIVSDRINLQQTHKIARIKQRSVRSRCPGLQQRSQNHLSPNSCGTVAGTVTGTASRGYSSYGSEGV